MIFSNGWLMNWTIGWQAVPPCGYSKCPLASRVEKGHIQCVCEVVVCVSLWNMKVSFVLGQTGKMQGSQGLPLLLALCSQLFRPLRVLPPVKSCWPQKHLFSELTAYLWAVNVVCLHLQVNVYFQMLKGQFTVSLVYRPSDFPLLTRVQGVGPGQKTCGTVGVVPLYHARPAASCISWTIHVILLCHLLPRSPQRPRGLPETCFSLGDDSSSCFLCFI